MSAPITLDRLLRLRRAVDKLSSRPVVVTIGDSLLIEEVNPDGCRTVLYGRYFGGQDFEVIVESIEDEIRKDVAHATEALKILDE